MKNFEFKGLMVPVFTPFKEDQSRSIDLEVIDKYALYLKEKGVHGVMVNGLTGEGMTLRVEERKQLAEEWFRVTREHELKMLLNIGGTAIADVYELAEHAEKLGVDGILVLPDLIYRPAVEEDLVVYLRGIAKYAPSIPLLYYHIPLLTNVYLKMWRLYDLVERDINNFGGIYYADSNIDNALEILKTGRTVILATGKAVIGAMTLGFDAISHTVFNLLPGMAFDLYDNVINHHLKEALVIQERFVKNIREIWSRDDDWIAKSKSFLNDLNLGFQLGSTRKPVWTRFPHDQF